MSSRAHWPETMRRPYSRVLGCQSGSPFEDSLKLRPGARAQLLLETSKRWALHMRHGHPPVPDLPNHQFSTSGVPIRHCTTTAYSSARSSLHFRQRVNLVVGRRRTRFGNWGIFNPNPCAQQIIFRRGTVVNFRRRCQSTFRCFVGVVRSTEYSSVQGLGCRD